MFFFLLLQQWSLKLEDGSHVCSQWKKSCITSFFFQWLSHLYAIREFCEFSKIYFLLDAGYFLGFIEVKICCDLRLTPTVRFQLNWWYIYVNDFALSKMLMRYNLHFNDQIRHPKFRTAIDIVIYRATTYPSSRGNTRTSWDTLEAKLLMALEHSSMDR